MDASSRNSNREVLKLMTDLITDIWVALKDAGMPDVMLYLSDGTASRCHWDETALVGTIRVALLADQERKIVRIVPVHECKGIGVATPKTFSRARSADLSYVSLLYSNGISSTPTLVMTIPMRRSQPRCLAGWPCPWPGISISG